MVRPLAQQFAKRVARGALVAYLLPVQCCDGEVEARLEPIRMARRKRRERIPGRREIELAHEPDSAIELGKLRWTGRQRFRRAIAAGHEHRERNQKRERVTWPACASHRGCYRDSEPQFRCDQT